MKYAKFVLLAIAFMLVPGSTYADIRVFDFDDGTLQGFDYVDLSGAPYPAGDPEQTGVSWIVSDVDIDIGDGFDLLQGSSVNGIGETDNPQRVPNPRIIPDPWENRDCLDGLTCPTQLLLSPTFTLDDSGPISVDIMGGQARGGTSFDENVDFPPEFPGDFDVNRNEDGWQGFALYDVAADSYVRWGFPSFNNDGKERDGRDVWERVEIPQEDLAELAGDGKTYRLDIFDSYLGGWGWIGIDTVQIPDASFTAISAPEIFDCNGDGVTDAGDLSCVASVADRDTVLGELGTLPGDLDGNGDVGFPDFLILSSNFGNESGTYAEGNIDLAGGIGFPDFLVLSANFGQTAAAQAVPEPDAALLWAVGLIGMLAVRKKRND